MFPRFVFRSLRRRAAPLVRPRRGATAVEYALLVAMIGAVAILGMRFFGTSVAQEFKHIDDTFVASTGG